MKNKCPSWRARATVRPRCQGRAGFAFIEAKRRPLTEQVDGSGAGFSQEGHRSEMLAKGAYASGSYEAPESVGRRNWPEPRLGKCAAKKETKGDCPRSID